VRTGRRSVRCGRAASLVGVPRLHGALQPLPFLMSREVIVWGAGALSDQGELPPTRRESVCQRAGVWASSPATHRCRAAPAAAVGGRGCAGDTHPLATLGAAHSTCACHRG